MPPVQSIKNQYLGVNAHFNSNLQQHDWVGFHAAHIVSIATTMQRDLYALGYEADVEQSLQIKRAGMEKISRSPRSDITIYDRESPRYGYTTATALAAQEEIVQEIADLLDLDEDTLEYYSAVAIYKIVSNREERGQPVAWIELLSPSNKPQGQHFETYRVKRDALLSLGLVFVEIDYLHESPPTFASIPSYAPRSKDQVRDADSAPYRITIVDPHPSLERGYGRTRLFRVDESLPTMKIPLAGTDVLTFDFGAPYLKTFEEMLYGTRIDYSQLPDHFDSYSDDDKARILSRMLVVLENHQAGQDLECEPQSIKALKLDEAQTRLAQFLA